MESGKGNARRLCGRGLEALTTKGKETFSASVGACISAVIDEQEIQRSNNRTDHDRLAIVSLEASKRSLKQAIKRATKDEREARKTYRLDDKVSHVDQSLNLGQSLNAEEPQGPKVFAHEISKKDNICVDLGISCYKKEFYSRGGGARIVPYLGRPPRISPMT